MYLLAYLELFQGNEGKCSWSAKFLFDRQKVVIADHRDRERWERYFEPCIAVCPPYIHMNTVEHCHLWEYFVAKIKTK